MAGIVKFYRHATTVLNINNTKILVDPMYKEKGKWPPILSVPKLKWNPIINFPDNYPQINENDILLITHHHFDHFDKTASNKLPRSIKVISPSNGIVRLRRMGFKNIIEMRSRSVVTIDNLTIKGCPVQHTLRFPKLLYKEGLGYLINSRNKKIYISGDTVLFDELLDFLGTENIDLAILYGGGARIPILGRHTLSHKEILRFVDIINPHKTLVIHLNALNHCPETIEKLESILNEEVFRKNVIIGKPGNIYQF